MTNNVSLSLGKIFNDLDKSFNFDRAARSLWPYERAGIQRFEETDEAYSFEVYVPGYNKSNIGIKFDKRILIVSSKKKDEENTELHRFKVGDKVDVKRISAKVEDGILTLTLPKKQEEKGVEIQIE